MILLTKNHLWQNAYKKQPFNSYEAANLTVVVARAYSGSGSSYENQIDACCTNGVNDPQLIHRILPLWKLIWFFTNVAVYSPRETDYITISELNKALFKFLLDEPINNNKTADLAEQILTLSYNQHLLGTNCFLEKCFTKTPKNFRIRRWNKKAPPDTENTGKKNTTVRPLGLFNARLVEPGEVLTNNCCYNWPNKDLPVLVIRPFQPDVLVVVDTRLLGKNKELPLVFFEKQVPYALKSACNTLSGFQFMAKGHLIDIQRVINTLPPSTSLGMTRRTAPERLSNQIESSSLKTVDNHELIQLLIGNPEILRKSSTTELTIMQIDSNGEVIMDSTAINKGPGSNQSKKGLALVYRKSKRTTSRK